MARSCDFENMEYPQLYILYECYFDRFGARYTIDMPAPVNAGICGCCFSCGSETLLLAIASYQRWNSGIIPATNIADQLSAFGPIEVNKGHLENCLLLLT
jgi:hypothetical protein